MVELQVARPAYIAVHRSKWSVDLTFEAGFQLLHSTIMDDDPAALSANKLFDVIELWCPGPLTKLPSRNSTGVTECAKANWNVCEEKQCNLQPKEVGDPDNIQLYTVSWQASYADRVNEQKSE